MVLAWLRPVLVCRADGGPGARAARVRVRLAGVPLTGYRVYLSIITQALTYALMLAFFRNEMGFGATTA